MEKIKPAGIMLALLFFTANACAINATVAAGSATPTIGQSFLVTVTATQLTNVLGYQFRIGYDPAKLAVEHIEAGDYLSACSSPFSTKTNQTGSVGIDNVCLGQTVSSGTTLAQITFKALATGDATLDVTNSTITIGKNPSTNAVITEVDGIADIVSVSASAAVGGGTVRINNSITVTVNASQLSGVHGYSFRVSYDPAKLSMTGISAGNYLSACSNPVNMVINGTGIIGLDSACLGAGVSSGTTLASITFKALEISNASLELSAATITLDGNLTATITISGNIVSITPVPENPADSNGDGHVDYHDLLTVAGSYGRHAGDGRFNSDADLNGDGVVDYKDLLILAANYGR